MNSIGFPVIQMVTWMKKMISFCSILAIGIKTLGVTIVKMMLNTRIEIEAGQGGVTSLALSLADSTTGIEAWVMALTVDESCVGSETHHLAVAGWRRPQPPFRLTEDNGACM
jgi:hypothetical protein